MGAAARGQSCWFARQNKRTDATQGGREGGRERERPGDLDERNKWRNFRWEDADDDPGCHRTGADDGHGLKQ